MKTFLIRFAQIKEDFRLAELQAICSAEGINFPEKEIATYSPAVPLEGGREKMSILTLNFCSLPSGSPHLKMSRPSRLSWGGRF